MASTEAVFPVRVKPVKRIDHLMSGDFVPAFAPSYNPQHCPNCGDSDGLMFVIRVRRFRPGIPLHWMRAVDQDGFVPGELFTLPCPHCRAHYAQPQIADLPESERGYAVEVQMAVRHEVAPEMPPQIDDDQQSRAQQIMDDNPALYG